MGLVVMVDYFSFLHSGYNFVDAFDSDLCFVYAREVRSTPNKVLAFHRESDHVIMWSLSGCKARTLFGVDLTSLA